MFQVVKIPKDKQLSFMDHMAKSIKDGELSISTKLKRLLIKESTKNMASTSTDHSTSDQDFHEENC